MERITIKLRNGFTGVDLIIAVAEQSNCAVGREQVQLTSERLVLGLVMCTESLTFNSVICFCSSSILSLSFFISFSIFSFCLKNSFRELLLTQLVSPSVALPAKLVIISVHST